MRDEREPILEFSFTLPKIGVGKHKNEYVLMNNAAIWLRFYKSAIANKFKEHICSWSIPESSLKLGSGRIEYQLYRPNKKRLDSDAPSYVYKWVMDSIVSQGYFSDDDQIALVLRPCIVERDRVETEVLVKVYGYEN